jgi:hypothetical protein
MFNQPGPKFTYVAYCPASQTINLYEIGGKEKKQLCSTQTIISEEKYS